MALYVTRPRRDEERIGRGLPSGATINVFTRHLNMECFESAVPAIFLSYAPTFLKMQSFFSPV